MSDATAEEETQQTTWIALDNWLVYGLFGALTLAGVAISLDPYGTGVMTPPPPAPDETGTLAVPLFVYVYATLGALGYIFTKLMSGLEEYDEPGEVRAIVEMGMRIPAAWVLGAGFYVVLLQTGNTPTDASALFGAVAFLVGLYINVAIKSLGSLADRMLGRGRKG
ncbi:MULTISPECIES: hypothetical protein [Salinibaculum]|uniref:hypothetical protein n=1 Tax=Salinibaculum TaxID=2732368 RepID=UPI0030D14BBF